MGVFVTLTAFISLSLLRPQNQVSLDTTVTMITADLRAQQLKAMNGQANAQSTSQNHGLLVNPSSYVLFAGTSYSSDLSNSVTINLNAPLTLSTTFANSQVVFAKKSGEILNFSPSLNTITITNTVTQISKTISVNQYGVTIIN